MARDPYDILGVSRNAGDEEIRRAYRRLAKQEHPDAEGGSEGYFCRLNDAYEAIRTEERRRALARPGRAQGPRARGGDGHGGPGTGHRTHGAFRASDLGGDPLFGGDLFGIFDRVLGGLFSGAGGAGTSRAYEVAVGLSPTQARNGVSMTVSLPDGERRIDIPPGVRDGDRLSYRETDRRGRPVELEVAVVLEPASR
jgi:curved DNA-binding protein